MLRSPHDVHHSHRFGAGRSGASAGDHRRDVRQPRWQPRKALDIVRAVADSGAQLLKLQTYTADTITIDADTPPFRISSDHELWGGRHLYDLYDRGRHAVGVARADLRRWRVNSGSMPFSSPFDPTAIEFLEKLDVPAYKVASSELIDLPLVRAMAETGKPVVISTGMATLGEIDAAVRTARSTGNENLIVLGCTASYPAPPEETQSAPAPAARRHRSACRSACPTTRSASVPRWPPSRWAQR